MSTSWQPGDPLMPDNGCGGLVTPTFTPDERANVIAEGGSRPPWWRPDPEPVHPGAGAWTRFCKPCGVGWRGDTPCWMCGQENA